MSKEQGKAKKGMVINRKHNRTVNQDVAHSDPKWEDMGHGILKLKGRKGEAPTYVKRGPYGRLLNVTAREVSFALAPKDAPEEKAA
jgi:hypothetical protein